MADDLSNRGARDRATINLSEAHEIAYWTKALDISEEKLRAAVRTAGSSAEAVRAHLSRK